MRCCFIFLSFLLSQFLFAGTNSDSTAPAIAIVARVPDSFLQLRLSNDSVSKNDEFKKIVDELEKTKKLGKVIKVAEVIKDKGEKEKKVKKSRYGVDKAEKEKEYLKRADIQEAANVLTDLILLSDGKELGKIALNIPVK